jgi:hypothetical protein
MQTNGGSPTEWLWKPVFSIDHSVWNLGFRDVIRSRRSWATHRLSYYRSCCHSIDCDPARRLI